MRGTTAKRYLLREDIAKEIFFEVGIGVPIATVLKKYELNCSRPTLVKLVDAMALAESNLAALKSTSPDWLEPDGPKLQQQPDDWRYVGRFPLGHWEQVECNDTLI
jgi:hypothetical protein